VKNHVTTRVLLRLPGKAAGQGCRARLPGKAAGIHCQLHLKTRFQHLKTRFHCHSVFVVHTNTPGRAGQIYMMLSLGIFNDMSTEMQGYIVRFGQCSLFLIPINKRQPLEISVVLSRWPAPGRCTVVNSAPIVNF
jgi:hypothetical protein